MKKALLTIVIALAGFAFASAQKFALVDMEYILSNIPAYELSNQQINQLSAKYQTEVDLIQKQAEAIYDTYQKEKPRLSEDMRKKYEDAVVAKEKEASELRYKYFGPEGELFKKRQQVMEPIQNKIYEAIKQIAEQQGYQTIFDRATSANIIYASPRIDISDEVLSKLGYNK